MEAGEAKNESDNTDSHAEKGPRGPRTSRPPVQIHVHEDAATGRMTVQTDAGEHELGRADAERIRCDAAVSYPDRRNTTTIESRQHGGSNHAENLTTLCGACHRLWHERSAGLRTANATS